MKHSIDFFKDEIRNGFYIPTVIKTAWANTLDVLAEIDRICEKYGITYYADWGTLLGAVRHGGFIPWDDDLDICMKRDDYSKFREVADAELPENYCIHDFARHEDHWLFLARVVNNKKMCFEPGYLKDHYNFPWLAGVDIFVKDYLYSDPDKEKKRDREILDILACADGFTEKTAERTHLLTRARELSVKNKADLPLNGSDRDIAIALYALAEREMSRVKPEDSFSIGQIFPWILKNGPDSGEPASNYEHVIRLPFEDTTIPVPAKYHKILKKRYGNYDQIRKVWGGHDYPYFEAQKKEMEKLSGSTFRSFAFDRSMLDRPAINAENSLRLITGECITGLYDYSDKIISAFRSGEYNVLEELFSGSIQLAEDLGTLIENVKGASRNSVKEAISSLEEYCNRLVESYNLLAQSGIPIDADALMSVLDNTSESLKINILDRKEIVFLTKGPADWKNLIPYYKKCLGMDKADIYVIPLPLMEKDIFGNIISGADEALMDDSGDYQDLLNEHITDYMGFDLSMHCPDMVYFQDPYDSYNPFLTLPPDFHSENLRKYTKELILIPIGRTSEFGEKDINDQYNLLNYISTPGVIYADKVVVQSQNIRNQYIHSLCSFAGKEHISVWEEKIVVSDETADSKACGKKKILYCIGLSELTEHPDIFIEGVKKRLKTFSDAEDKICLTLALYPFDSKQWTCADRALSEALFELIDKYDQLNTCSDADDTALHFDAYYGSSSPFVPAFSTGGKPVMIADYSI